MRKIVISLLFLFLTVHAHSSTTDFSIPNDLSVREHWISLTKSYDIETKTNKLGTLYRRFFSLLLTYDFYDPMNVKTATATARFFSFGAHLDIYDQTNSFIGGVEEHIFTFFPTFSILGPDSSTKLARAEMNFWGTKFYIYDPASNQEMAIMSRPFFRFKNDWTIHVTNRALLEHKHIDSRVLMTVLAVQGEIEDWKRKQDDNDDNYYRFKATAPQPKQAKAQVKSNEYAPLAQQVTNLEVNEGLDKLEQPTDESLEALADELDQGFNAEHPVTEEQNQSNEEQVKAFTAYCMNLINSNELPDSKKKAILTLLNLRLQGHN